MQAFLEPEIFEGAVTLTRSAASRQGAQLRLVDGDKTLD
jgi:hypothetical protein